MNVAAVALTLLAALLHVVFFVFESVLWMRPSVHGRFGIRDTERAATIRPMAWNQGFYNLALAVGAIVGAVLLVIGGDARVVGVTLVVFATGCMAVAGVVLATTGRAYRRAAAVQFVPAAAALVLTLLS